MLAERLAAIIGTRARRVSVRLRSAYGLDRTKPRARAHRQRVTIAYHGRELPHEKHFSAKFARGSIPDTYKIDTLPNGLSPTLVLRRLHRAI